MAIAPPIASVLSDPSSLERLTSANHSGVCSNSSSDKNLSDPPVKSGPQHPCYSLSQYHDIYIFWYLSEPEIISILCYFWSILFLQESKVQSKALICLIYLCDNNTAWDREKDMVRLIITCVLIVKWCWYIRGREDLQDYILQKVLKKLIHIIWRKKVTLIRHFRASCLCTFGMREQTHSFELHCKEPEYIKPDRGAVLLNMVKNFWAVQTDQKSSDLPWQLVHILIIMTLCETGVNPYFLMSRKTSTSH